MDQDSLPKGGLVYPTMFNVVVDNFIVTWLSMTVKYQRVADEGLGETARRCIGVFYKKNGMVGSCDLDWLQQAMNILVSHFRRYGMAENISKSCTMACQLSKVTSGKNRMM